MPTLMKLGMLSREILDRRSVTSVMEKNVRAGVSLVEVPNSRAGKGLMMRCHGGGVLIAWRECMHMARFLTYSVGAGEWSKCFIRGRGLFLWNLYCSIVWK